MNGTPPSFHLLAKPTGPICNLDCSYCFFLSKEMLYPGDRFRMADDLLETYIAQLLESHTAPEVMVAWQGGEPTMMGLDFFRRSVELVEIHRRPGQRISYSIQTNGTRLSNDWAVFFKENGFLVGLSVDGPREFHDAYRLDKQGKGSFDRVMAGYEMLAARDVDVNVLCTVHAANQDHPLDVYRFFRDEMGVQFIQFIPIVERVTETLLPLANLGWASKEDDRRTAKRPLYMQQGHHVTDRSIDAGALGRFLTAVFDEWVRADVGEVFVQHFDVALGAWHGEGGGLCIFAETCGLALAMEHNGDLYACDHYVEPDYLLGNITETPMIELIASEKQQAFGRAKRDTLPQYCLECDVRFACNGGCPRNRFIDTPAGDPGLNYLCAGYKTFFAHIDPAMKLMSRLLNQGRAPSEISKLGVPRRTA
ncbi:MAG: anaerobic sulfatase maturase [Actinobacteria bacterium]|nr:anaerobic sulfatase maturase [Actinomycetota bacterium]